MIIVKLKGGLGNQMFQYAFGKALSIKLNQQLFFDTTVLTQKIETATYVTDRDFELSLFPEIDLKFTPANFNNLIYSKSPLLSKLFVKTRLLKHIRQVENEFIETAKTPCNAGFNIFEGYFQSEKYFHNHSQIIRSCFRFPQLDPQNNSVKGQIANSNSVAIHIRRGDYSTNLSTLQYHGILPAEYFRKSIELLNETQHNLKYFVFTDDVSWALENFKPEYPEAIIVEGNAGANCWKDMALMTYAKHHIISNSSFSWWGAWLSTNDSIKIAPKNWFNPEKAKFDIHSIVPESWSIIDC